MSLRDVVKSSPAPMPVLIDTDTGVDDALAIVYAMHSHEVRVEAITTVAGNVEVEKCTRNVKTILKYLGAEAPPRVVGGCRTPLRLDLITAPEVHGRDGLGNTQTPVPRGTSHNSHEAVDCIRDLCEEFSHQLTIIALGPLTNIALAFKKHPRSLRKVKRIVSMGGAFRVPGNTGPVAEFNYFVDPHAANDVLQAGLPVTIVPLDVTEQIVLLRRKLKGILGRRKTRLGSFLYRFTGPYMGYHKKTLGFLGGYLHDPMATAIAICPTLAECLRVHVDIECKSELTRGMSVADFRKPGSKTDPEVVVSVNCERFLTLFQQRVLKF